MHPLDCIEIPTVTGKPRSRGLTSILDRGAGSGAMRDVLSVAAEWIDVAKLGWGLARLVPEPVLREKVELYREHGIRMCTGGTLVEVAVLQGVVPALLDRLRALGLEMLEVSDGVVRMDGHRKDELIRMARERGFVVWSEVGRKLPAQDARMSPRAKIEGVLRDLEAGAERVVLEARESGTIGIYDADGRPEESLIERLVGHAGLDRLVFEAPRKDQQAWMVRRLGPGVNLANVAPTDALPLATLRTGLRGDTLQPPLDRATREGDV